MWSSNHFSTSSCFPSFSGPDFLGSMFFRVQVFQGPCFSGSKFFRFPVFSGSRFFMVRVQVLEGARSKDYLEISASVSQHRYFFLTNFFLKKYNIYVQYTSIFFHLVSSYMVLPSICSNYSLLNGYLLIRSEAPIGALEKSYLNFRKHLSISVLTKQLLQKLLETFL